MAATLRYPESILFHRGEANEGRSSQVQRVLDKKRVANKPSEQLIAQVYYEISSYVDSDMYRGEATAKFIEQLKVRMPMQGRQDKDYPKRVKVFLRSEAGKRWMESWFQPNNALSVDVVRPQSPQSAARLDEILSTRRNGSVDTRASSPARTLSLPGSPTTATMPTPTPSPHQTTLESHEALRHPRSIGDGGVCVVHGTMCGQAGGLSVHQASIPIVPGGGGMALQRATRVAGDKHWKRRLAWIIGPMIIPLVLLLNWLLPEVQKRSSRRNA